LIVNPGRASLLQNGRKAMAHMVYESIVTAVKSGRLREPFSKEEFRVAFPNLGGGTYNAFLWKHRRENGKTSELFDLVSPGRFRCIRPFLYGL
jgi:hypothetical protein